VTDQDTAVAHYYLWKFLGTVSVDVDDDCDASLKLMAIGYARCQYPAERGSTICGRLLHMYVWHYTGKFDVISTQTEHTYYDS
jgi:hypothetical protein